MIFTTIDSDNVGPVGSCAKMNYELQPPYNWKKGNLVGEVFKGFSSINCSSKIFCFKKRWPSLVGMKVNNR